MEKRVTLKDMSERLGLSQNTISLVLRGMPGISETTREMVLRTAREMGYAGRRRTAKASRICVVTTCANSEDTYYFGRLQNAVEKSLNQRGCATITINNIETYTDEALSALCAANNIEGVIVVANIGRELMERLERLELPLLCAGFYVPGLAVDSVMEDNVTGMTMVMEQLRARSVQRAGFIGPVVSDQGFFERWMAFHALAERLEIEDATEKVFTAIEPSQVNDIEVIAVLLSKYKRIPEAFVCANDKIAITVIKALQQLDVSVPEACSVVGFDNTELAKLSTPMLASVDNFLSAQAECAVHRILQRIDAPLMAPERILCGTQFVEGDSLRQP